MIFSELKKLNILAFAIFRNKLYKNMKTKYLNPLFKLVKYEQPNNNRCIDLVFNDLSLEKGKRSVSREPKEPCAKRIQMVGPKT